MKYVTIKVLEETRTLLRLIAAQSGEQMVQVVQRLCKSEWDRIRNGADKGAEEQKKSS
jgi:hypothetical protein